MRMTRRLARPDSTITAILQFLLLLMKMVMKLLPEYGKIKIRI